MMGCIGGASIAWLILLLGAGLELG
jgi:hypothetical protein